MPRLPRHDCEGVLNHAYARGVDKRPVFLDAVDRRIYLELLAKVVAEMNWSCLAYCLMDNHIHLLVLTPDGNLSEGMQRLHGQYAQAFNRRHGRRGHLFESRFGAVPVTTDAQLWAVAAYIARNPVEAGLCPTPESWRWSSFGLVLTQTEPPWLATGELFARFGANGGAGRAKYVETVRGSDPFAAIAA
jgi:putative transposase